MGLVELEAWFSVVGCCKLMRGVNAAKRITRTELGPFSM